MHAAGRSVKQISTTTNNIIMGSWLTGLCGQLVDREKESKAAWFFMSTGKQHQQQTDNINNTISWPDKYKEAERKGNGRSRPGLSATIQPKQKGRGIVSMGN